MPQPLSILKTQPPADQDNTCHPQPTNQDQYLQAVADHRILARATVRTLGPQEHQAIVKNHPACWTGNLTLNFSTQEDALEFARQALTDIVAPVPAALGGPTGRDWHCSIVKDRHPRE